MNLRTLISFRVALLFAAILAWHDAAPPAQAQIPPDQQAKVLLNTARQAYNDKNHFFAVFKFREFLSKFGSHKDAPAARFGLALALIEGEEKKYDEARDLMQPLAASKDFAERTLALYYAGVANRGLGLSDLAKAETRPAEAARYRTSAQAHFKDAVPQFNGALAAFLGKVKKTTDKDKLTIEAEWAARARCDLAEVQIRVGKWQEARISAAPFVSDPVWSKSQYRNLGRYYFGYACVLLKDHAAAQKTLSLLTPFNDPYFGNHARYLLARAHHLGDDRAEAAAHYDGVIADYAKSKAEAMDRLKKPEKFKRNPELRARLEALVKDPTPDHVARATFYLGVLHYEGGKFGDARARFAEFVKAFPQSPLRNEAEVRLGYCQVQLKNYAEAIKTLTPLVDKDARLSDQVLFWLGKAQAGQAAANPNPQLQLQGIAASINTFKTAAERAQKIGDHDPEAKLRRGEILLEMADQMQRIWQNREAAAIYKQLLTDKILTERGEEIMQRLASALHLAGDYAESDKTCANFRERFPMSTLTPAVLFTFAENSYFRTLAAEKNPNQAERAKELPAFFAETAKRFQKVIEKYPEFPKINVARFSLGLTYYRQGDLAKALKTLSDIPAPDRSAELGLTSFLIGDCLMRQVPATVPDDALAAGKMEEQLKSAADALDAFIIGQPKDANIPDALIKCGLCQQRLAGLIAQPRERNKMYQTARNTYERLMTPAYLKTPQMNQAIIERAKCIAQMGDMNTAMNELRRFTADPLKASPMAPQAILQLATYLRAQNKAAEAVELFTRNRAFLEASLPKDQDKGASMTALLRYHHGVALREAGKLPQARELFEAVVKMGVQRPEASEAALGVGQCLKDEGQQKLDAARKLRPSAKKPEDIAKVQKLASEGLKFMRDAVAYLETQANQIKVNPALQEVRGRMLYEAAWGARILAEPEIESARAAIMREAIKKLNPPSAKFPLPEVAIEKVPLQPSEKRARGLYKTLIEQVGDAAIATESRFELAEMLTQRHEHDAAIALLNEVLDKEPPLDMTEKVRLRLGVIHAAKGNIKAALQQFDAVAKNAKSPLVGWAQYRAGEALIQDQKYPDAIKRLTMFRDQGPWQNVAGLSDRALLRLGYAYALTSSWDNSRAAYERLVNGFPKSPWQDEARYGMGWALQQQKNYDAAANVFSQVVARTATELAAKAQLQIGLCRMEQKRYLDAANAFLVIPSTYDYPELRAAALLEAGKAYLALNQPKQANRQFERILREFPNTPWADAAKEKLGQK